MSLHPFVIDCDTGRDDALAIWISLHLDLPLRALISSYGNTALANVSENNRRVLALTGTPQAEKVMIFEGAEKPGDHKGYRDIVLPRQKASGNGLCNLELPAAPENREIIPLEKLIHELQSAEQWDYIITGPATNFATLLEQSGEIVKQKVKTITMMGGKFDLWEQIPGPDFNIACDPFAVRTIMESGIPFRFVPMDATWPIALTLAEIERLQAGDVIARTARDLMIAHCRHFAPEPVFRFHDPSVIMACLKPDRFKTVKLDICMDEANKDFARLIPGDFDVKIYDPDDQTRREILDEMLKTLGLIRK